jgi:hypothetical protein
MNKRLFWGVPIFILSILYPKVNFALEDISLLPKGVRAFMYRQGFISEIGSKYSSNYQLGSIQYRTSQRIDASMIRNLNPEFDELVQIMNNEFPGYELGSKVYLGDLIIDGSPKINYSAPVVAYGVSDRYMTALVFPIVDYNVHIKARHEGKHNIAEIRDAMPSEYEDYRGQSEEFSDRLEDAYRQLNDASNLSRKLREICESKNLRCLGKYQQHSLGDIQWVNRFLLHKGANWSSMIRAHVNLPTGPKDDPNNMIDLPLFGRTYVDTAFVSQYAIGNWKFHNSFGVVLQKPDRITKRVPKSEDDFLPGPEQEESVKRKVGDTLKYEFNFYYQFNDSFGIASGMQKEWKYRDSYSGSDPEKDYSLMSKDTGAELLRAQLSFSYSTINAFLKKEFAVPLSLSYNFSDIVSGKNVERQSLHELSFVLLF